MTGSWVADHLPEWESHVGEDACREATVALLAMVLSSALFVILGFRICVRRVDPISADWGMVSLAIASLFMARSLGVQARQGVMSMPVMAAPLIAPIIDVTGVLIRIDDVRPLPSIESAGDWNPLRGIIEITGGGVPALIGCRMPVRFDRPGGQEISGTTVRLRARLHAHRPISNPGVGPFRVPGLQVPATLVVPHPGLVDPISSPGFRIRDMPSELRSVWRDSIRSLDDRVTRRHPSVEPGLITALLAGDRRWLAIDFKNAAMRSGLSHLLAISGLHLAVIGMIAGGLIRACSQATGRLGMAVLLLAVIMFGFVVVPAPSVHRSLVMAIAFGVLALAGRRVRVRPLVLLSLAWMCWWDPTWPRSVGFQLTAVATIALACSTSIARRRWFGSPDRIGTRRFSVVRDRFALASTAGIVAWITTMPVVLANFGIASVLSVPATILAVLLMGPILGLGVVSGIVESMFFVGTPDLLVQAVSLPTRGLVHLVIGAAGIAPPISTTTSSGGMILSVPISISIGLLVGCDRARIRIPASLLILLLFGCFIGFRNTDVPAGVRMVDVGDGSAIVVRSGRSVLLFDAGSSSISNSGSRVIVPTLRRTGVRGIDVLVLSHANTDHFDGVTEIIDVMPVGRLLTTGEFLAAARSGRSPRLLEFLERIHAAGVPIETIQRGQGFLMGRIRFDAIHPVAGERHRTVNDSSLVLAVRSADAILGDHAELILTGDIQDEAIARVMRREPDLTTAVLELPHHGSWRPAAAALVTHLDPEVVIQSTGRRRWRHDRFGEACTGRRRRVTSRDGSFLVELGVD